MLLGLYRAAPERVADRVEPRGFEIGSIGGERRIV
jgi:hypothetical protein